MFDFCIEYKFDFNSTMVRLKEKYKQNGVPDANIFQFHYGSIKSN